MTKQEAIIKAFGQVWDKLSYSMQQHILTRHPWVDRSSNRMNLSPSDLGFEEKECEIHFEFWRPIALKGIETNNGWTKIESEKDLPKDKTLKYKMYVPGLGKTFEGFWDGVWCFNYDKEASGIFECKGVTHYKPIEKELLPIY